MITNEQINKAKTIAISTAKYGLCFGTGILVGTVCGFFLCFKLLED